MTVGDNVHDGAGRAGMVVVIEPRRVCVQYVDGSVAWWHVSKVAPMPDADDTDDALHDEHVWTWIRECWLADETNPGPLMLAEAYWHRTN